MKEAILPKGSRPIPVDHLRRRPHILTHKGLELRYCSYCETWYPLSAYWNNAHHWDGLQSYCKICTYELNMRQRRKR